MASPKPELRFFTADDGVRIAYTLLGSGPAVVQAADCWSSIERRLDERRLDETSPSASAAVRWSAHRTVLLYDIRGVGSSQRECGEITLERCVDDLAELIGHLGVDGYSLRGAFASSLVAAAFAARRPPGLDRLLLIQPFARGSDITTAEAARGQIEMIRGNWPLAARAMTSITHSGTAQRELARMWVRNMSAEVAAQYVALQSFSDIAGPMGQITVPTRVVFDRRNRLIPAAAATTVAALIPGASYVTVENSEESEAATDGFLGIAGTAQPAAGGTATGTGTAVILFADIASSTALTERLGDAAFRERSRALDAAIREAVRAAGGTAVDGKVMGDGVMAVFGSAREAIDAALRCREASARHELGLHLGIHAGDVIRESGNVYGGAVNIASRVCDASEPGEILVSDIVRGLARTSAGVDFDDRGERQMKGIEEPVRVWAVRKEA